ADATDLVARKQKKYDDAKAKDKVDTENLELNDAQSDLKLAQDAQKRAEDNLNDTMSKYGDEAKKVLESVAEDLKQSDNVAHKSDDRDKAKAKYDQAEADFLAAKKEYDRRAAYRENG